MKKSHIFIIVIIAIAISIIVSTADDASTYVNFDQAYDMALAGKDNNIHVVGQLKKDTEGHVVGIQEGVDRVSFSFILVDDNGKEQKIEYNEPMPADMLRSEKVVVVGSYQGDQFKASKIILKCPSKYQEQNVNV
ncbi:cytochrome c maturation protein CcmE domain-containing protein [Ohtaekwangia koreensis]|jgi:cytochrome c-type biogenesis protein CcmE|uniref:Cytochrome c-type biogenesis protein CcmE n=1 Tax=Ohtaekwangia koreensis TaxID=688867 RepID=A0A1T5IHR6_9BACT|nr:cytochrome c maturation protein CcmE [Ohtaekwangia koreensis]SKC38552.1 cytochrome c-type biogenesis protein CcmE [Ohtaekwangia koreensis]